MTTPSGDLGKCSKRVMDKSGWHQYQCRNAAKVTENAKVYCTIHAPSYRKAKRKDRTARWEAAAAIAKQQAHRAACFPTLLAACEAVLPALRWGMTHQPGNLNQWTDSEKLVVSAIAQAQKTEGETP